MYASFGSHDSFLDRCKPVTIADKPIFDRYLKAYPPVISELTFTNIFAWAEVKHHLYCECDKHLLVTYRDESTALMKTLSHISRLELQGIVVMVGGELAGFAIGEALNTTTFVEHFEKGLPDVTGMYPFLLHEFAKSIPDSFTFLNREQDLGIEGIRKAKESWHPAFLERKYTLRMP